MSEEPNRFMICAQIQTAGDARLGKPGRFENFLTHLDPPDWLAEITTKHFHQFGAHVVVVSAFPIDPTQTRMRKLAEVLRHEF